MIGFWGQVAVIARTELTRERRAGEVLWVTIPFGAIAVLLVPIAIGIDAPMLRQIGPGLFWIVVMLFGVLVAVRRSSLDAPPVRDQLALAGLDPAAVYVGRSAAAFVLLLTFEAIVGVTAILIYDLGRGLALAPITLVLAAAGLALLGTLAASIVSVGRNAAALVPLLVAPLSVPLLIGATQAHEAFELGRSSLGWVLMMVVTTIILAIAGVLSAGPLQETG